jgi:hypothetical protein
MRPRRKHLLLTLSKTVSVTPSSLKPEGANYVLDVGAWVISRSGRLFIADPNAIRPATKKHDIETGEDQKSE